MKKNILVVVWFTAFGWAHLQAQVQFSAKLETDTILIGDPVLLLLEWVHPSATALQYSPTYDLGEKVEVLSVNKVDTVSSVGGSVKTAQTIVITAWESGLCSLSALKTPYQNANAVWDTAAANALLLYVNDVPLTDSATIAPIKDILKEPTTWEDYLWWLVGGAAALLLGGFAWWWFTRKKNAPKVASPPLPAKQPYELALEQLNNLDDKQLWQKGEVKAYQSELTDIIRHYIGQRYGIAALELTSAELLAALRKEGIEIVWEYKLDNLLNIADLVKFAKATPPENLHQLVMQDAKDFVRQTIPKPIKDLPTEPQPPSAQP